MVEISGNWKNFGLIWPTPSAHSFPSSAFSFGSCKEGWYYRCLGLDPINVTGSAGPIRLVVNEEEKAGNVIDMVLKTYAREGRLPVLGYDLNKFLLYCPIAGSDGLSLWDPIGRYGVRNFMLGKKPESMIGASSDGESSVHEAARKGSGSFKAWLNKSLNLKISSH